jgi:hypothetical protein
MMPNSTMHISKTTHGTKTPPRQIQEKTQSLLSHMSLAYLMTDDYQSNLILVLSSSYLSPTVSVLPHLEAPPINLESMLLVHSTTTIHPSCHPIPCSTEISKSRRRHVLLLLLPTTAMTFPSPPPPPPPSYSINQSQYVFHTART